MSREDKMTKKTEVLTKNNEPQAYRVVPRVDVYENNDELLLVADMPGVSKDHLDIRLENYTLTISGQQVADDRQPLHREHGTKHFERSFTLPHSVDGDKVTAEMNRGELKVHLPKSSSSKTRQIPVRVG